MDRKYNTHGRVANYIRILIENLKGNSVWKIKAGV
jgi:hypothetical protein